MNVCYTTTYDHQYGNYYNDGFYHETPNTSRFVLRSKDEEEDNNFNVYRSTPENNRFVGPTPFVGAEYANTATVPRTDFKSIAAAEACPTLFVPSTHQSFFPQDTTYSVTRNTLQTNMESYERNTDNTLCGRATPVLPSVMMEQVTELDEDTILNRSATIQQHHEQHDDEDGRQSPFGPAPVVTIEQVYIYKASRVEIKEMEQMKWQIQQHWFQRCAELKQREPYWGTLQDRDGRVFFHPGAQRGMIVQEQKFVEQTLINADPAWATRRRKDLANQLEWFTQEETKHKQELMRVHLEQKSSFYNLPILANRFLLKRLLGKGGNAEVWDVVDFAHQKRSCALKLSISHKHARREHYTHAQLRHPHIVNVDETAYTIEYQEQLYTAFAVDSGETDLQQMIELNGRFEEGSALRVLSQLLSAVMYLHNTMYIAHYDIKPSNILVGWNECIKLTDFDLARRIHEPIKSSVVGTLRYLPPECFRPNFGACQATAEKADIWMIGIVYCVLLCGQHPIVAEKASSDAVRATLKEYTGRLEYFNGVEVSELSRWIIQGCLDPDPRRRPTASELVQTLEASINT